MKTRLILPLTVALFGSIASIYGADLSTSDQKFVHNAAQGGMLEVRLGAVAKERAKHPDVKKFGEMMASDHGKANDELKSLAAAKGVQLKPDLESTHQNEVDRLSKLADAEFDKAYVENMVDDHEKDVSAFEDAAKETKDPELKAFIDKTLPVLRAHLDQIRGIKKSIGE